MKRALLLINRGASQSAKQADKILPLLEAEGLQIVETETDVSQFKAKVEANKGKIDLVIVAGGDGSCLSVCALAREANLPMGVIPLGTANNLARSLGVPSDVEGAVKVIGAGITRPVDVAYANGKPFLNVTGMGLSTQVNRGVPAEWKKRWGVLAYVVYFFKVLRRMRPFWVEIECDGKVHRAHSLQITVCNGRHYGSGLTIAEDAEIDDGRLDLLSTKIDRWWEGLSLIPSFLTGRYREPSKVKLLSGKSFTVRTHSAYPVDTDGEITTRSPVQYKVEPGALTVLAPESRA